MKRNNLNNEENSQGLRIKRETPLHQLLVITMRKVIADLVDQKPKSQLKNSQNQRKDTT